LQHEFLDLVRETAARGATVFISSHVLREVESVAERVAIIRTGRIVDVDSVRGLRQRAGQRVLLRFAEPPELEAFALGAASGRRAAAVGGAAALAALTYVFQGAADGAGIELLAARSPFAWYLDPDPLATGLHAASLLQLSLVSLVAALLGLWRFGRRDLMT